MAAAHLGATEGPTLSDAIAWLLRKSPVMLPIRGTSKVKHLEENASAGLIKLDDALIEELEGLSKSAHAEAA